MEYFKCLSVYSGLFLMFHRQVKTVYHATFVPGLVDIQVNIYSTSQPRF